jgi:hypothetical protein
MIQGAVAFAVAAKESRLEQIVRRTIIGALNIP